MEKLSKLTEGLKAVLSSLHHLVINTALIIVSRCSKIKYTKSPIGLFTNASADGLVPYISAEDPGSPAPDISTTNNGAPMPDVTPQISVVKEHVTPANGEAADIGGEDPKSPVPIIPVTENPSQVAEIKPHVDSLPHHEPPLYALIIAINEYTNTTHSNLLGAVPDAKFMKDYLEKFLGVPPSQIKTLFDAQATRTAIIQEIRALADDDRIKFDDPILIYYAGHGSTELTPKGWKVEDPYIQMIIPQDYGDGVYGIRDRTIGLLINRIAEKKGNNITVIFDCCFSGSSTRTEDSKDTHRVRGFESKEQQPENLDEKFVEDCPDPERATATAKGFAYTGLRSHILLSACGAAEHAHEKDARGLFTNALLETLYRIDAEKTTYIDIVDRIPELSRQNPQCEGVFRNRILFDSMAPAQGRRLYPVQKEGNYYVIEIGAASGITFGAQFALYRDKDSFSAGRALASLNVVETNPFDAKLEAVTEVPSDDVGPFPLVLQTHAGPEEDLRLHIAQEENLERVREAVLNQMHGIGPMQRHISLVVKDKAELDVAYEDDHIVFNILDKRVLDYGLTRIPHWIDPVEDSKSGKKKIKDIPGIMRSLAHYHWHLRRSAVKEGKKGHLQGKVNIELTKLERIKCEGKDLQSIQPIGENLICDNVVKLDSDDDAIYGFKIINTLTVPLYVSVFYFNNSDLSIKPYFEPSIATRKSKVDPPLPANGSLTIGYGSSGAPPFRYYVPEGQNIDVGFIKFFLSTEQVDLSSISCVSPFTGGRSLLPVDVEERPKVWDTILLTLALQKGEPGDSN